METNLRAEPCEKLYATDASPSGAGSCVAPRGLARLVRFRRGEHVRLDWQGEEPPSNTCSHCTTCVEAGLGLDVFVPFFSFLEGKHINLLELESLISLLKRVTREGVQARRLLVLVDSRVVFGAVSKVRSSSRKINFLLRKLGLGASLVTSRWS